MKTKTLLFLLLNGIYSQAQQICMIDENTGWRSGSNATTLISNDNGTTWTTDYSDKEGVILKTEDGGTTWKKQNVATKNNVNDVCFINTKIGWVVGDNGTIMKTMDGGNTWINQDSISSDYQNLDGIYFVDSTTGWAVGTFTTVIKTIDGGTTWKKQMLPLKPSSSYVWLHDIHFISKDIGWVIGNGGTVLKTTDGGVTWENQKVPRSAKICDFTDVYFIDEHSGWITAGDLILRTNDGGHSWTAQIPHNTLSKKDDPWGLNKELFYSIYFSDENTGWAVGCNKLGKGILLKTTNGGISWVLENLEIDTPLRSVCFLSDKTTGWIIGDDAVFKTIDGGESWQLLNN